MSLFPSCCRWLIDLFGFDSCNLPRLTNLSGFDFDFFPLGIYFCQLSIWATFHRLIVCSSFISLIFWILNFFIVNSLVWLFDFDGFWLVYLFISLIFWILNFFIVNPLVWLFDFDGFWLVYDMTFSGASEAKERNSSFKANWNCLGFRPGSCMQSTVIMSKLYTTAASSIYNQPLIVESHKNWWKKQKMTNCDVISINHTINR